MLAVAIGSFVASTLLSHHLAGRLQQGTQAMLADSLPALRHLHALRTGLFHEELLIARALADGTAGGASQAALRAAAGDVRRETAAYETVPALLGERPLTEELRERLDATDRAAAGAISSASPAALDRCLASFEAADASVLSLLELESAKAGAYAASVEVLRARSETAALLLDALSTLLALVLARSAWRTWRGYLEQEEAQRWLLDRRASELDEFAGRVAHDILNPLHAAALAVNLIQRGAPPRELAGRADASLKRLSIIVDALLDFARAGGAPRDSAGCAVKPALEGVLTDLGDRAHARGVSLAAESLCDLRAACHPGALASIAGNLIGNAIKYIGDGPERRVRVRARARGSRVRVEVEDSGPGVPRELAQVIFQPFVRGGDQREPGIGLGLATAKRLCEAHGGAIGVSSIAGRGATFWFELPLAPSNGDLERGTGLIDAGARA